MKIVRWAPLRAQVYQKDNYMKDFETHKKVHCFLHGFEHPETEPKEGDANPYTTDWNALMEVVTAIKEGEAELNAVGSRKLAEVYENLTDVDIEGTYQACVRFIAWTEAEGYGVYFTQKSLVHFNRLLPDRYKLGQDDTFTDIQEKLEDSGLDYFYASLFPEDVLEAVEEEAKAVARLGVDLVEVEGTNVKFFIALY